MEAIKQAIVVEGRDDKSAVLRAVDAYVITTSGFGITNETLAIIEKAYNQQGIIILTDPDFAGEKIRKRLSELFPNAKHAYIARSDAKNGTDIGVENADPSAIINALKLAKASNEAKKSDITMQLLEELGLAGGEGSAQLREEAGKRLGIGFGNSKAFLKELNWFGITKEELLKAWTDCNQKRE